jgi:hypothetical protein
VIAAGLLLALCVILVVAATVRNRRRSRSIEPQL